MKRIRKSNYPKFPRNRLQVFGIGQVKLLLHDPALSRYKNTPAPFVIDAEVAWQRQDFSLDAVVKDAAVDAGSVEVDDLRRRRRRQAVAESERLPVDRQQLCKTLGTWLDYLVVVVSAVGLILRGPGFKSFLPTIFTIRN